MPLLSILDQAPTRAGTTPAESIRDVATLATQGERLGFHRFWIAEHHAMGGVASSAPEVVIGHVANATREIRVGSGGMLLPNHRPIHVAEQFLTLAALHPGRIDLGIGRSEGALHEPTVRAFGRAGDLDHGGGFDEQLAELLAFGGVRPLAPDHPLTEVSAGPRGSELPPVFLLGSSPNSAVTAARNGLGYGFAAYSNTEQAAEALRLYRREFVRLRPGGRPHAILGLKVVIGIDDEHAERLALPWHLALVQSRAGTRGPMMSPDQAERHRWTEAEIEAEPTIDRRADVVGSPERAWARLEQLVAETEADEVIASTNTFDPADRLASYRRLAAIAGLPGRVPELLLALPGWGC